MQTRTTSSDRKLPTLTLPASRDLPQRHRYLMFLIHALYQKLADVAIIIFNVKHADLLHVHEPPEDFEQTDRDMYRSPRARA